METTAIDEHTRCLLAQGDAVFLYTDGVSEATDEALDDFTDQRLAASLRNAGALPCREILHCVTGELLAFTDRAPQFDDITMLSLHILWPTEKSFSS